MRHVASPREAFQRYLAELRDRLPTDDDGKPLATTNAEYAKLKQDAYNAVAVNREWKRALGERGYGSRSGTKARSIKTRHRK